MSKGENDEELLNDFLLEGDDFITEERRREREAEKRRQERKRRLQQLQQQGEYPPPGAKVKKEEGEPSQQKVVEVEENVTNSIETRQLKETNNNGDDNNENNNAEEEVDDDDDFDMFSSFVSPVVTKSNSSKGAVTATANTGEGGTQTDWDDAEGYYKTVIGELITVDSIHDNHHHYQEDSEKSSATDISFRVAGVIGKGVFSTVLKCTTISNATSVPLPPTVAIKCIRSNETMAKTAYNEIRYLQRLKNSPGIVPLLLPTGSTPLEHKGHVMLVFPCAEQGNLRDILNRFGKGVGLSLDAVRSYFGQLIAAVSHLKKHSLIHADLKVSFYFVLVHVCF